MSGDYERELLHLIKPDFVRNEKFDKIIGQYSWKLFPDNELKLFSDYITE